MADFTHIPVIDVAPLSGGDAAAADQAVAAIAEACETAGFLYVVGHGVPAGCVAGVFDAARWFFGLPQERRDRLDVASSPNFRGYVPMGLTGPGVPRRLLEAFQIMIERDADDPDVRAGNVMYGPNRWPEDAPAFRAALTRYYAEMDGLSDRLLGAFARGLDLPADHFRPFFAKPLTQLRLLHYPPQPAGSGDAVLGVEAHTDTGAFTILLQDDTGGLEVRNRAGAWVPAVPIPGAFVVNIGDMMQRWTNGRFVSTPHRVANRSGAGGAGAGRAGEGRGRISVPFFANPDYAAVVAPLPGCVTADRPAAYEPLACGPYVEAAYRAAWPRSEAG